MLNNVVNTVVPIGTLSLQATDMSASLNVNSHACDASALDVASSESSYVQSPALEGSAMFAGVSGEGEKGSSVSPEQNNVDPVKQLRPVDYSRQYTSQLTRTYVDGFLKFSSENDWPMWLSLQEYHHKNIWLCIELEARCKDTREAKIVERVAIQVSDSFKSGVSVGYLLEFPNPNFIPNAGSAEFREGVRVGQFYRGKSHPLVNLGVAVSGGSYLFLSFSNGLLPNIPHADAMSQQLVEGVLAPLTAFGNIAQIHLACSLLANRHSRVPAEKFERTIFDRYQRHPIAASIAVVAGIDLCNTLYINAMSEDPSILKTSAMVVSYGALVALGHMNMKIEERAQEKYHGEKYVEYRNRTPMYVFNLWKASVDILKKIKKMFS